MGYAVLIAAHDLQVPLPQVLCAITPRHQVRRVNDWQFYTPRHSPENSLEGHLVFALKREGLNLLVLKRLFTATGPDAIEDLVRRQPTSAYARRIWFLYEWLMGDRLNLPDAARGSYVDALDPALQFSAETGTRSRRHRVLDNLPGSPAFCPLVFVTPSLKIAVERDLAAAARAVLAPIRADLLARAAAFLLLDDSRSSFAIENERPTPSRIARWGQAVEQAGRTPLDLDELVRLQRIVIGDARFVPLGLRTEGGFVGEHDKHTRAPIPVHISARAEDLRALLGGLVEFANRGAAGLDPVIAAACVAFGFVYIHPFQDGNGRVHRYLFHHVLAERRFTPPGVVFPVSAVILRLLEDYKRTLEMISKPLLPLIEWEATEAGNLRVLNETADLYRYFDATPHAEFFYRCVAETIERDLPRETKFLAAYDAFERAVEAVVDFPQSTFDLLFRFLSTNEGRLSARARAREFARLTGPEVDEIERLYARCFAEHAEDAD